MRPEARQVFVKKILRFRPLNFCYSPCNPQILPVLYPNGEYQLVQDLRIINEAVISIYPLVSDPYRLLFQIPGDNQWYTVLDLKDALFSVPLHPDSQFYFSIQMGGSLY